jgi:hypothetical protein
MFSLVSSKFLAMRNIMYTVYVEMLVFLPLSIYKTNKNCPFDTYQFSTCKNPCSIIFTSYEFVNMYYGEKTVKVLKA